MIQKFCYHGNVTSHFSSLLTLLSLDYSGTSITFAKTRFGYIEVLFHTLYCNWGRKYRSLYRGSTVRQRKKNRPHPSPQVLTFVPICSFPSLWILHNPNPSPSLPPILSCRGLVLPCFSRFYMYWQFNSYPTIISGDRTKWFSINSLLFWKIGGVIVQGRGGGGGEASAFAHHQMSCSSFDSPSPIFP